MPQQNSSPEERLLHLIRKDEKSSTKKMPEGKKKLKLLWSFSFGKTLRCLLAALLILGTYLLLDVLIINSGRIEERVLRLGEEKTQEPWEALPEPVAEETEGPISYYTQPVKSRNLFTAKTKAEGTPSATFKEKVSKLRLQGIITEPYLQAIIEDTKSKETYFLSTGDTIGDIEVKEILPGKVRLHFQGQEAELAL